MGLADLVPGISGGTIAFITGIYERFISAIAGIGKKQFISLFSTLRKKEFRKTIVQCKKFDYGFLLLVLGGILSALLIGAAGISYLFENYQGYTLTFFVGLIISSCFIMYEDIKKNISSFVLLFIGFLLGLLLLLLTPSNLTAVPLSILLLGGFIASSAMILPGISGSFILLVLGLYPLVLSYLSSPLTHLIPLLIFLLGVVAGIVVLSRVLNKILKIHRNCVISLLLGLVIGALLVPISMISQEINSLNYYVVGLLLVLGISLGIILKKIK